MIQFFTVALFITFSVSAAAADCDLGSVPKDQQTSSPSFQVGYRLDPPDISVSEPFSVILEICDKDGSAFTGTPVADAHMPMHGHGMNYQPQIKKIGEGMYRADGFLFHMPGKWQFRIDIEDKGKSEQVTLDRALR